MNQLRRCGSLLPVTSSSVLLATYAARPRWEPATATQALPVLRQPIQLPEHSVSIDPRLTKYLPSAPQRLAGAHSRGGPRGLGRANRRGIWDPHRRGEPAVRYLGARVRPAFSEIGSCLRQVLGQEARYAAQHVGHVLSPIRLEVTVISVVPDVVPDVDLLLSQPVVDPGVGAALR